MSEKTFSNVLYLTSVCQLACKYCYELETRKKLKEDFYITEEEIEEAVDFFVDHNKQNRNLVLFGGEPLLAWDKIQYVVNYAGEHPKLDGFSFDLITNGIRLADKKFFGDFFVLVDKYEKIKFKIEISYDGKGQVERVFPDGSSSQELVLKSLDLLEKNKREFYIRYTLNTTTYDIIEEELIYLFEKYQYLSGITVNIAASNLDALEGNYKISVNKKIPSLLGIYSIYKKPICDFACKYCRRCIPTDFNMHYVPGIGNKISSKDQGGFDRWNPLTGKDYEKDRYDLEGRSIGKHV